MSKTNSLPNLNRMHRFRQTATPDAFLRQTLKSDDSDVNLLKQKLDLLQKQLTSYQQNQSFVMKITNAQCTLCTRLKQQLDLQEKNERAMKRRLEIRIEELLKSQPKVVKVQDTSQYDNLLMQLKEVGNWELFFDQDRVNLKLYVNNIEEQVEKEQPVKVLQVQPERDDSQLLLQIQKWQNKVTELQALLIAEQQKNADQKQAADSQITSLRIQLEMTYKATTNKFKVPNDIQTLKRTLDQTIQFGQFHQLSLHNQALKEQLIQQNQTIDKKAQENQVQRHLIKIETLETELYLSLRCFRCKDLFEKPLTYIPCGHSCCEKCFKPQCDKCQTETVYRNQQFDELLKIYRIIKETKVFIKGCLLHM